MNYDFSHYPDMDHDGDCDLKDSAMFHDMMEEGERQYRASSYSSGSTDAVSTTSILILSGVLLVIYFIAELIFG